MNSNRLFAACLVSAVAGCNLVVPFDRNEITGSGGTSSSGGGTSAPNGGGGAGGTPSSGGGTSAPNGGGGSTTTTMPNGGGGTGGTTGTPTLPTSCTDARENGATGAKVTEIDPDGDGPVVPFDVFCDQDKDGGGWALLYNSVGDPVGGQTTAFWNIPYDQRFVTRGDAALDENYYAGALYRYGKEYRDDAVDTNGTEALGILRATANGINDDSMKLTQPVELPGSLSSQIYSYHFASGWSSSDHDDDPEAINCAAFWANVTQHYAGCWKYSLGADSKDTDPGPDTDYTDGGWGPHIVNKTIDDINLSGGLNPPLARGPGGDGDAARMTRISRFTRW